MRRAVVIAAALVVASLTLVAGASSRSADRSVVLGSHHFAPYGDGFGEVAPRRTYLGGVPSGLIKNIHWRRWGHRVAKGHGRTYIYKPHGGYYRGSVRIKLKAHSLGHCPHSRHLAYKRLSVRIPKKPGGPLRHWRNYAGHHKTICKPPYYRGGPMRRHRNRLALAAAALGLIALAAGTATATAPLPAHRITTYAPQDCTKPRVEPRRIVFACGDAGLYVNHLRWTKWRHLRAKGKGVLHERTCDPYCLGSPFKDYPVRIRLRKVKRGSCGGERVPLFRKAILSFPHKTPDDAHRVHKNQLYCSP